VEFWAYDKDEKRTLKPWAKSLTIVSLIALISGTAFPFIQRATDYKKKADLHAFKAQDYASIAFSFVKFPDPYDDEGKAMDHYWKMFVYHLELKNHYDFVPHIFHNFFCIGIRI